MGQGRDCAVGDSQSASRRPAPRSRRGSSRIGKKGNGMCGRMVAASLRQTRAAGAATAVGSGLDSGSPKRKPRSARHPGAPTAARTSPASPAILPPDSARPPRTASSAAAATVARDIGGRGRVEDRVSDGFQAARASRGAPLLAARVSSRCLGSYGDACSKAGQQAVAAGRPGRAKPGTLWMSSPLRERPPRRGGGNCRQR